MKRRELIGRRAAEFSSRDTARGWVQTLSYTPRAFRLAAPESIHRVMAAKISDGRLPLRPRTLRTSAALNCLGSDERTARQLTRPRGPLLIALDAPPPLRPINDPRRASSSLSLLSIDSFKRMSLRKLISSVRACRCTCWNADAAPRDTFFRGM